MKGRQFGKGFVVHQAAVGQPGVDAALPVVVVRYGLHGVEYELPIPKHPLLGIAQGLTAEPEYCVPGGGHVVGTRVENRIHAVLVQNPIDVTAVATIHIVIAAPADEGLGAGATEQLVVAVVAVQHIAAVATQSVVAGPAVHQVHARVVTSIDDVVRGGAQHFGDQGFGGRGLVDPGRQTVSGQHAILVGGNVGDRGRGYDAARLVPGVGQRLPFRGAVGRIVQPDAGIPRHLFVHPVAPGQAELFELGGQCADRCGVANLRAALAGLDLPHAIGRNALGRHRTWIPRVGERYIGTTERIGRCRGQPGVEVMVLVGRGLFARAEADRSVAGVANGSGQCAPRPARGRHVLVDLAKRGQLGVVPDLAHGRFSKGVRLRQQFCQGHARAVGLHDIPTAGGVVAQAQAVAAVADAEHRICAGGDGFKVFADDAGIEVNFARFARRFDHSVLVDAETKAVAVGARTARQNVGACAAIELVISRPAIQYVVACAAREHVAAGAAGDAVGDIGAGKAVGRFAAGDVEAFRHQFLVTERRSIVEFDVVEGALCRYVGRIEGRKHHCIGGIGANLEQELALRPEGEPEAGGGDAGELEHVGDGNVRGAGAAIRHGRDLVRAVADAVVNSGVVAQHPDLVVAASAGDGGVAGSDEETVGVVTAEDKSPAVRRGHAQRPDRVAADELAGTQDLAADLEAFHGAADAVDDDDPIPDAVVDRQIATVGAKYAQIGGGKAFQAQRVDAAAVGDRLVGAVGRRAAIADFQDVGVVAQAAIEIVVAGAAGEDVVVRTTKQNVVAGATFQIVVAGFAQKLVRALTADQAVLAAKAPEVVITAFAVEIVVALIGERNLAGIAEELVVVRSTVEGVGAATTHQRVLACFPVQIVVAVILDGDVCRIPVEAVVARTAEQFVCPAIADDEIVAISAIEVVVAVVGVVHPDDEAFTVRRQQQIALRAVAVEDVVFRTAKHEVVADLADQVVLAGTALDHVVAVPGKHHVVAVAAVDGIRRIAFDMGVQRLHDMAVGGRDADQDGQDEAAVSVPLEQVHLAIGEVLVVALARGCGQGHGEVPAAEDEIVAGAALDDVAAAAAVEQVHAVATIQQVVVGPALQGVVARTAVEDVVTT